MQIITVVGYLGKDANENVNKETGEVFYECSVGCSQKVKNKDVTTWYRFLTNNKNQVPFLKKGTQVMVHGDLVIDTYENSNSEKITTIAIRPMRIQFLGKKEHSENTPTATTPTAQAKTTGLPKGDNSGGNDDLPF
jgi:single-stranded DNA-binding protein